MRVLSLASAAILLAACNASPSTDDYGIAVPGLDDAAHEADGEPTLVLVGLEQHLPDDFIGCLEESEACYVLGKEVEAELRYEPQSGRYWFMDPGSGNTYYFDGELRTGDPLLVVAVSEEEAELPPGEEPSDHTGDTDEEEQEEADDDSAEDEEGEDEEDEAGS
jgi:hypothetical protein